MTNHTIETPTRDAVQPVSQKQRTIPVWVLAIGLAVVIAITALIAVDVMTEDAVTLTRGQQAEMDRWVAIAGAHADGALSQGQLAEMARWQGWADYYGVIGLTPAQLAEAERLQSLAD